LQIWALTLVLTLGGVITVKRTKIVGVRLPIDHPLFLIEPGKRGEVARSWLDCGVRLERLEQQVERILAILEANPPTTVKSEPSGSGPKINFDKEEFLSYFG
jgi:hypothetical protein